MPKPINKQVIYKQRLRDVSLYLNACWGYKTVGWLKVKK